MVKSIPQRKGSDMQVIAPVPGERIEEQAGEFIGIGFLRGIRGKKKVIAQKRRRLPRPIGCGAPKGVRAFAGPDTGEAGRGWHCGSERDVIAITAAVANAAE